MRLSISHQIIAVVTGCLRWCNYFIWVDDDGSEGNGAGGNNTVNWCDPDDN